MWIEKGFACDIPTKLYVDSKHRVSGLCLLSLAMFIRVLSFVFSSHWFIRELNQSAFGFGFGVMTTHY